MFTIYVLLPALSNPLEQLIVTRETTTLPCSAAVIQALVSMSLQYSLKYVYKKKDVLYLRVNRHLWNEVTIQMIMDRPQPAPVVEVEEAQEAN